MHEGEGDVAAEDDAALRRDAFGQRARHGIDAGDRGDAERDAGDEDVEAGKPAAQLAKREAKGDRAMSAKLMRRAAALRSGAASALDAAGGDPDRAVAARGERRHRG